MRVIKNQDLGLKIKDARRKSRLTQSELAKKLNKSVNTIVNWENNRADIGFLDFLNFAKVLDININDIFESELTKTLVKKKISTRDKTEHIGVRIKNSRKKRKLTQLELASFLNKTPQAISSWERGLSNPSYEDILRISDFLNISVDHLYGRAEYEVQKKILIGEEIKTFRELEGLTQEELAEEIGIPVNTIKSWEDNHSSPKYSDQPFQILPLFLA